MLNQKMFLIHIKYDLRYPFLIYQYRINVINLALVMINYN